MTISGKNRRRAALVGGLSAAMLISIAANSGLSASAAPTPKPTSSSNVSCPATPGVTPTAVNLGWIGDKTGAGAPIYAGSPEAFQLRVDQENAKGGVNGRKLVTKYYDDQTDPSVQIAVAQKAIQSDNVFGLSLHSTQASLSETLKSAGIPYTGFSGGAYGTDRNAFGIVGATTFANPELASTTVLQKLKDVGVTKLANVTIAAPAAQAIGTAVGNLVPLVGGMTQVLRISDENAGLHDATSTALRIKNSGADGAQIVGLVSSISIAQALKQQGVSLKGIYIVGLSDPSVLKTANGALDGAIGANYGTVPVGINNRAVKTFTAGMKAAGLNPYNSSTPIGYLGADLLIKGLKLAGKCPTRASFINNLRNLTKYDGAGLLPAPVSFKGPGVVPNGNPGLCTWFIIAKGADLVPDAKASCGKIVDTSTGKVVYG